MSMIKNNPIDFQCFVHFPIIWRHHTLFFSRTDWYSGKKNEKKNPTNDDGVVDKDFFPSSLTLVISLAFILPSICRQYSGKLWKPTLFFSLHTSQKYFSDRQETSTIFSIKSIEWLSTANYRSRVVSFSFFFSKS